MIKDIGNFVGRYYQVLGWISLAGISLDLILNGRLHVDLTFLLWFWAGYHLRRHSPTARRWTLGLSGAGLGLLALAFIYALVAGTEKMTVHWGGRDQESLAGAGRGRPRDFRRHHRHAVRLADDPAREARVL